jgi:hypothetical protein
MGNYLKTDKLALLVIFSKVADCLRAGLNN